MNLLQEENAPHDDEFEVVDGEICWDPDEGIIGPGPYEKRPDEYKVYETIQGKTQVTDLNGNPLFGVGTGYPSRSDGLKWNPLTETYERMRPYQWGAGRVKVDARMFNRVSSKDVEELEELIKKYL